MCSKPRVDTSGGGGEASGEHSLESITESLALLETHGEDESDSQDKKGKQKSGVEKNMLAFYGTYGLGLGFYGSSEDKAEQLENAFHMQDELDMSLSLPGISENPHSEPVEVPKDTKKRDSFRKRLSAFTGSPAKAANGFEQSCMQKRRSSFSGFRGRLRFSRPSSINIKVAEQANMSAMSIASSSASIKSSQMQRSSGSLGMFTKYIKSPSKDTASLDFDFSDCIDEDDIHSGRSSHDDMTEDENQAIAFKHKVKNMRKVTGTEIKLRSMNDTLGSRRPNDPRIWNTRNLRCAECVRGCPVCDAPCCIYEEAHRTRNNPDSDLFVATQAEKLVTNIRDMGGHVKDTSTFTICTMGGGCKRHVCPDCCGICPNEACWDIQCTDCKPDPWGPCDWHD